MEYEHSNKQYDEIVSACKKEFLEKNKKYGNSLEAYKAFGVLEKIFIKLFRIQTIQEKGVFKVEGETIDKEFPGVINYCFYSICLIKQITSGATIHYAGENLEREYDKASEYVKTIFQKKNHDYGEAWRQLTIGFMVQECIGKYNRGKTIYQTYKFNAEKQSELQSDLLEIASDICNYAIFCAILISEGTNPMI